MEKIIDQRYKSGNNTGRISKTELIACILIILFTLQNLLDNYSGIFSYIDELPALFAIVYSLLHIRNKKRKVATKEDRTYVFCLWGFALIGLFGNVLFRYQKVSLVVIDLLTNLKFFLTLFIVGKVIKKDIREYRHIPKLIRILTLLNFGLFVIDRFINIFPGEYRYGIKSAVLYFDHSTYLAGICVFYAAVLSYYSIKRNRFYILINLFILAFTLRGKALAAVFCYIALYIVTVKMKSKLKVWQMVVLGLSAIAVAWSQIYFYFFALQGSSARSVMLLTSFRVMKDYFPIGTGFGTFASHSASVNYSPVYIKYGFRQIYELSGAIGATSFFDDHFWPIIIGQTGAIGTAFYLVVLGILFKKIQRIKHQDRQAYFSALFVFLYLLISSMAEPAFNNSIAIPLALILGCILAQSKRQEMMNALKLNRR